MTLPTLPLIQYYLSAPTAKDNGDKKAGKLIKMTKDPLYLKIVDEV